MSTIQQTYTHEIDGCLAERVGEAGLTAGEFEAMLVPTVAALDGIRGAEEDGSLPVLRLWRAFDDLDQCEPVRDHLLKDSDDVVFFGVGGSSLGARTLAQLTGHRTPGFAPPKGSPRFHFFDNLDGVSLAAAFESFDLARTRFLVISKSGRTAETLSQLLVALAAFGAAGIKPKDHFAIVTEPTDNPLRRLAEAQGFKILDHDPKIGGRFSVLSNVGLLPAMLMGLDVQAVRAGAGDVIRPILEGARPVDTAPAVGAALSIGLMQEKGLTSTVLMPYADRLDLFALWYRQLWAESLGKGGAGTTPIPALGPIDQHSQVQLYLDGPRDKLFTLIMTEVAGGSLTIDANLAKDPDLSYLAGRTIGDLVDAEQRATAETLIKNGRPTRIIHIKSVDERTMGALFMHFMLETIIAAHLLSIYAFDQPAAKEGKVLVRQFLSDMK